MPAAIANGESGLSARTKINEGFVDITHGGVDNAMLRADGTDATLQSSGLVLDDSNNILFPDGSGLDFSASAGGGATSSLLDDYEEGDHTATVTTETSGTITLVAAQNTLTYEKVGDFVHVHGTLVVDSVSSPVGFTKVSLPFTIGNLTELGGRTSAAIALQSVVAANISDFINIGIEAEAFIRIYLGDATTQQNDSAEEMQAGSTITISASYRV